VPDSGALPILLNARAGSRRQAEADRLERVFAEHGVPAVVEAVEPGHLMDALARLSGRELVGVAGGDGTLRTAARALAGSDTILLPVPTGTLNHFARRLGIETVDAAAAAVRTRRCRTLPVGRANDHVFLNTAVLGGYPRLVELRERMEPFLTKWPAAALASAFLLARWPRVPLVARTAEAELRTRTAMFWVGVGQGSFPAVHESPVPDPHETLEAVVLPGTGRRAAWILATALLRHRLGHPSALERSMHVLRAPWIDLEADRPVRVALDGEPHRLDPPVRLRLEPGALRVVEGD
jgi:diacylglycerol kinase family enzyme